MALRRPISVSSASGVYDAGDDDVGLRAGRDSLGFPRRHVAADGHHAAEGREGVRVERPLVGGDEVAGHRSPARDWRA